MGNSYASDGWYLDRIWKALTGQFVDGVLTTMNISFSVIRSASSVHRSAIAAADKVVDIINTDLTTADNGSTTGSLNASGLFYLTVVPGNVYGCCKVSTAINTQTTAADGANTHSIRITIPQKTGATYYDIFLSTDVAPRWVGRITEAQRAAGDYEVTGVGVVASGGGNPAGTVDVNVVGTGIQTSNVILAQSNAYITSGITAIDCTGKTWAHVDVYMYVTDIRSAPALSIVPFFLNGTDWYIGQREALNLLNAVGQPLYQTFDINVLGASGVIILIGEISGQGAAATVKVRLS